MTAGYKDFVDQNVRLIILKALAMETNASLNDSLLERELEVFGYKRTREYLRNQMRWLETEAGAVRISTAGTALIATLTGQAAIMSSAASFSKVSSDRATWSDEP